MDRFYSECPRNLARDYTPFALNNVSISLHARRNDHQLSESGFASRVSPDHWISSFCMERQLFGDIPESMPRTNVPILNLFEQFSLDYVGPLQRSNSGNKYILVAMSSSIRLPNQGTRGGACNLPTNSCTDRKRYPLRLTRKNRDALYRFQEARELERR
ncbi:uncharacterized protein BYT42DRAFT_23522 [Radiomyces spectabilis]|uniref:uncharacterized protein n=1 Tax=Radiomyces spectabilis TaxID=64574 RepID=UPI00221F57CC|nr:uncharacterized protein BYT42DRAFT_23522 [Radiomyces spectabilis]KAI8393915.1 hypothetical protein BYT42DRAFT_23522 [Radiomyces spectabilis]